MRISDWSSDVCSSDLDIARLQVERRLLSQTHARRRAGGDKIARVQRDKLADVMHQMGYVEDHGAGIAILEAFPIDIKPHAQVLRVGDLISRHQPGAYWAEGIADFTLVPGAAAPSLVRSEERRVGNEGVSTGRSR